MKDSWQFFLNSLATVGGNLFLLAMFVLLFLGLVLYTLHDANANTQVVTIVTSTFSSFSGALLLGLKGRVTDVNPSTPNGTSTTSSTTQTTTTPPVPKQ